MKKSAKILCAVLALVLALGCGVGGTLAWLSARTSNVVNTFTFGNLSVALKETTGASYQIVPGTDLAKDPKAAVTAVEGYDAVDAYLFVKAVKTNWPKSKVTFGMADGWTQVPGTDDVWYREVKANEYNTEYQILAGDATHKDGVIKVDGSMTKTEVETAKKAGEVKLTFTAYAVQKANMTVAEAWAQAPSGVEVPTVQTGK